MCLCIMTTTIDFLIFLASYTTFISLPTSTSINMSTHTHTHKHSIKTQYVHIVHSYLRPKYVPINIIFLFIRIHILNHPSTQTCTHG